MSAISREEVEHIAHQARLELTEAETAMFEEQLNEMKRYADKLGELDTENVQPMTHVLEQTNVMRSDEAESSLTQEEALKNAPEQKDGQYKVPSILD